MSRRATFDGATAIVTGGASGIGRALCIELARRGAHVTIADRRLDAAEAVAEEIGGSARAAALDVTDAEAFESLVEAHDGVDYLFNNAGIVIAGEVAHHTIDDWNAVIDVNVRGVANGVQAAYPGMLRRGAGHIVNTASAFGLFPSPGTASYAATKHAVVGLSRSLRGEAAPHGVRVSAICPGAVDTPFVSGGAFGRVATPLGDDPGAVMRRFADKRPRLMSTPEQVATRALDGVLDNRALIVVPFSWRLLWYLDRTSPSLSLAILQRANVVVSKRLEREAARGDLRISS